MAEFQPNYADGFEEVNLLAEESGTVVGDGGVFNDTPYIGVKPPKTDPIVTKEIKDLFK